MRKRPKSSARNHQPEIISPKSAARNRQSEIVGPKTLSPVWLQTRLESRLPW